MSTHGRAFTVCVSHKAQVRLPLTQAMYATIGYIVPEYYKFPGYLSPSLGLKFADVPNGLAALSKRGAQR